MLAYMYQAALYCEDCGRKLIAELIRAGKIPSGLNISVDADEVFIRLDERAYDSDEFPKCVGDHSDEASDSPEHCDSGEACVNALDLTRYGAIPELHGAETRRIGAWLENPLTSEGVQYTSEMVSATPRTPYQAALHAFWLEVYGDEGVTDGREESEDEA